jgi:hypothetical protein
MNGSAPQDVDQGSGRGRAGGAGAERRVADNLALPNTDWLRHDLLVIGSSTAVAEFRTAAAGAGAIPWVYQNLDYDEDDRFLMLVNPPDGSPGLRPAAARVLARELHAAVFQHQEKVLAQVGSLACPFDLQALVPVPGEILHRGPDDAASLAWLRKHWGVAQALRQVRLVPANSGKRRGKQERLGLEFWSADWTPWPALATIQQRFKNLRFTVTPDYSDG